MSDIKVGEYVRTKNGEIAKVIEVNNYNERLVLVYEDDRVETDYTLDRLVYCGGDYFDHFISEEIIAKHSPNIIDLIEVGDYVNGRRVYQVGYNYWDDYVLKMSESNYEDFINPYSIETIVTKEQFERMEYKV